MKRLRRAPRGQAMVEYTMVTHMLLISVAFASYPFLSTLMGALTKYYQSIYFVLTSSLL